MRHISQLIIIMNTNQLITVTKKALEDKKAKDIKVLDIRQFNNITDFMIVASGRTHRHVTALARHVIEQAKNHGHRALGEEGSRVGEWVLVDLGDVIVHVMQPQTRDFYQLEKFWSDMSVDVAQSTAIAA